MGRSYSPDDIDSFIETALGAKCSGRDADLFREFRIDGDDCGIFIKKFGKAFDVDLSNFRWYFHHGDEASVSNPFQFFFLPPNRRVIRIPITPRSLLASAEVGRWVIDYPPHSLPKRRYDIIALNVLIGSLFLAMAVVVIIKWLH